MSDFESSFLTRHKTLNKVSYSTSVFESCFLQHVSIWNKFLTKCQIFNQNFLQRLKFSIKILTTCMFPNSFFQRLSFEVNFFTKCQIMENIYSFTKKKQILNKTVNSKNVFWLNLLRKFDEFCFFRATLKCTIVTQSFS